MTLVKEKRGAKWYRNKISVDHYVQIGEPGTTYLTHITLELGTATAIAQNLHNASVKMGITSKIFAIGSDNTPVNTG